jgi:Autophagy protein ATG17-like domain
MSSIHLIDGHVGSSHLFFAEDEGDFRSRIEECTEVPAENQIVLIKKLARTQNADRTNGPATDGESWVAFTGTELANIFPPKDGSPAPVPPPEEVSMVCFDRRKVGAGSDSSATAIPLLQPDVVLLPSQQAMFNADEVEFEQSCLESAANKSSSRWSTPDKLGYVRRLQEVRLMLLNLHSAAATIVEGGQERLQSIRLALSQHDRLNLAFAAVTSQTLGKCSYLASEGEQAERKLQQTLAAATLIASEAPAWMERLASIPVHKDVFSSLHHDEGERLAKEQQQQKPTTLADTLPAGHISRLNELLAQCKSQGKEFINDLKDGALPALHQQVKVFDSICSQANSYSVGRREAFALLVSRAETDTASQKKARALVDGAFRDAVRACEVLFAAIAAETMPSDATHPEEGEGDGGADGDSGASGDSSKPSEDEITWALGLLSTSPFSDGAIDSSASSLASSDAHLSSLQHQAHALLVEAASAVNGHLATVAAVQSSASSVAELAADVNLASQALAAVCGELQHLQSLPRAYDALLAESKRRVAFEAAMKSICSFINNALQGAVDKERQVRDEFLSRFSLHLPGSLLFDLQNGQRDDDGLDKKKEETSSLSALPSSLDGLSVAVSFLRRDTASKQEDASKAEGEAYREQTAAVIAADSEATTPPSAAGATSATCHAPAATLEETLQQVAGWSNAIKATASSIAAPLPVITSAASETVADPTATALAYRCAYLESALASLLAIPPPQTPSSSPFPLALRHLRLQTIGQSLLLAASGGATDEAPKDGEGEPAQGEKEHSGSLLRAVLSAAPSTAAAVGPGQDRTVAILPTGLGFLLEQLDKANAVISARSQQPSLLALPAALAIPPSSAPTSRGNSVGVDDAASSSTSGRSATTGGAAFPLGVAAESQQALAPTEKPVLEAGSTDEAVAIVGASQNLLTISDLLRPLADAPSKEEQQQQLLPGESEKSAAALTTRLLSRRLAPLLSSFGVILDRCSASHLVFRASEFRVGENALFFPQGRRNDGNGRPIYYAFQSPSSSSSVAFYLDHDASVLALPSAVSATSAAGASATNAGNVLSVITTMRTNSPAQQALGKSTSNAPPSPPLLSLVGGGGGAPASGGASPSSAGLLHVQARAGTAAAPGSPALLPGPAASASSSPSIASGSKSMQYPDFVVGLIVSIRSVPSGPLFGGNLTVPVGASAFAVGVRRIG